MVVDEAGSDADLARGPALAMMLGAVCHDLGKPAATFIDGRIRSPVMKKAASHRPRRSSID